MTNCPLCQRALRPDPEDYDAQVCPTQITYPNCKPVPHYMYDGYSHDWYAGPYKLELDESGLSIYKVEDRDFKADHPMKPYSAYVMYLETQIPIDDSPKTINKIKTLILFS
jgi:hypothetical protein